MLEIEGQEEVDLVRLKYHITIYYKKLFGKAQVADMHLDPDLWHADQRLTIEDNEALTKPFSLEELDQTIKEMKTTQLQVLMDFQWSSLKLSGLNLEKMSRR